MRRERTRRTLLAASAAFCFGSISVGCASAPTAGTGDVAFRLLWKGEGALLIHGGTVHDGCRPVGS